MTVAKATCSCGGSSLRVGGCHLIAVIAVIWTAYHRPCGVSNPAHPLVRRPRTLRAHTPMRVATYTSPRACKTGNGTGHEQQDAQQRVSYAGQKLVAPRDGA
eukprot:COSAG05_NODE_604_length_8399_cov_6.936145_13_plen_102_part_00